MSYGDGSILEITKPDGKSYSPKRWRVCISYTVPTQMEDGTVRKKRKKVQRNVEGTKAKAKEVRDQLLTEHDANGNLLPEIERVMNEQREADAMTLTKFIEIWDSTRRMAGKASERTYEEDRNRLKHVERHLGNTVITEINAQMIEMAYGKIRSERNLGGTTMNHIHTLLKNVFAKAIDYDYIYKNPCARVEVPKREDPERKSLNAKRSVELLKKINESESQEYKAMEEKEQRRKYREDHGIAKERHALRGLHCIGNIIAVRIGLATGMRRGEVFGLIWENVDLERKTVRICQALTSKGTTKKPKTQAGTRTLAIDDATVSHLADWKVRQAEELAKVGVKQTPETPVCCSDVGGFYRIDNFEHWWKTWRTENGFEDLKFHELRHTQATMLLSNGVDIKTVQTRLGHKSPDITLSWYAHAMPENDHAAAQMLGNLLAGTPEESTGEEPNIISISKSGQMSPECPLEDRVENKNKAGQLLKNVC